MSEPNTLTIEAHQSWCAISDLHLSERTPRTIEQFEDFCRTVASQHAVLLVLGDLFEYWVGDDAADQFPAAAAVVAQMQALHAQGVQVYFMRGNRDVAVDAAFCARAGMTLLADPCVLQWGMLRVVLSHGDILCTQDVVYQRQRRIYAHPWVRGALLRLPLTWRVRLVTHLREKSRQRWLSTPEHLRAQRTVEQDVHEPAAAQWCAQFNAQHLLHGHTHRPMQHDLPTYTRWVLADWAFDENQVAARRGGYVCAQAGQLQLVAMCEYI